MRHRRAVAQQKRSKILAVGEVEAAAPGQQEFPADLRHPVINGDTRAALRQHLGRHQAGRPGADHRNVKIRHSVCLRKILTHRGWPPRAAMAFETYTQIETNYFAAF